MKNILVPTDFTEISKNALKYAVTVAIPLKARIILFHSDEPVLIASDIGGTVYADSVERGYKTEINRKMDELVEYTKLHNVESQKLIHKGLLGDDIPNIVEDEKIDLIVTGTHGAKGLDSFFFGTHSASMIEKVKCPVLIIPGEAKYLGLKRIMYATDFQYGDIEELKKICQLAQWFRAEVIITHINTDSSKFDQEEQSMDWLAEIGADNIPYDKVSYRLIHNENVFEGLERTIDIMDIDILCMSTSEKGFFKKLVSKSNTKEMAYHTKIPLMVLHLESENKLV